MILSGSVPKIPHQLFEQLEERDRTVRRLPKHAGHTHVSAYRPAKRVASASLNRPRAMSKLPPVLTGVYRNLKRHNIDADSDDPSPKVSRSEFYPVRRVNVKTKPETLQHVTAKRLKSKSASHLLYRRVQC